MTVWREFRFSQTSQAIVLLWLCFVVRGFYYSYALPLWEGFDEHSHFAYVQHVLHRGSLPVPGVSRLSYEVNSSLLAYPVPRALLDAAPGGTTYARYSQLSAPERERMRAVLSSSKAEDPDAEYIYESQQPPLYYWSMAPVLAAGERLGFSLPANVFLLRAASILLCSLALPLGWRLARRVLRSEALAVGVVGIAVAMPGLLVNVARVGNESLALLLYTLLACGCVLLASDRRTWSLITLTGLALGSGLLTKSYFLTAIPAVCLIFAMQPWRRALASLAAALGLAAGISFWWYGYIFRQTGDLTGQIQSVALRGVPWSECLSTAIRMDWWRALDTALFSHLWIGGWSFLQVRSWMYHLFYLVFLASLIGLAAVALRGRARPLLPLAILETCLCASLAYHAVLGQLGYGAPMTNGWYLHCLVFVELSLLCAGLLALLPGRWAHVVPPALAALFALLDIYGLTFVQTPYYAGLTSHAADGRVHALKFAQLPDLAGRLDGAWVAYLLATACTVWVAATAGGGTQSSPVGAPDQMPEATSTTLPGRWWRV